MTYDSICFCPLRLSREAWTCPQKPGRHDNDISYLVSELMQTTTSMSWNWPELGYKVMLSELIHECSYTWNWA